MKHLITISLVLLSGCAELKESAAYRNGTVYNADQQKFDKCIAQPQIISKCLKGAAQ